jgi:hypothetical protein
MFILSEGGARHFRTDAPQLVEIAAYPIRLRLLQLFLALIRGNQNPTSAAVRSTATPI